MGLFAIGDLVLIPFPFSDLSNSKMRPALIIAESENSDYIALQITSQKYGSKYSLNLTNNDLEEGHLNFDSYIKYSKIFTANGSIVSKKIAKLNKEKIDSTIECIINLLKNS